MKTRLLVPENVCLQIIDVQKSLMAKIHEAEKVAATVELMIHCAGILGIPVIANTQYKKGLGPYVQNVEALVADVPAIRQSRIQCLGQQGDGSLHRWAAGQHPDNRPSWR